MLINKELLDRLTEQAKASPRLRMNFDLRDSKDDEVRMLRYPEHFKYIKDNYPFLNQRLVNKKLGIAYGGAVYYDEGIVRKLRDFILACYYSPILILKPFEKLVDIFTLKKKCQKNCA